MKQTPLGQLIGHLSPDEQNEFIQAVDYLTEMSGRPRPPEGSISGILNSLSPGVRDVFSVLEQLADNPRQLPFQEKMSAEQYDQSLGLDVPTAKLLRQRRFDEDITAGVQRRMGTDADLPQEELSRRDHIAAALAAHEGE